MSPAALEYQTSDVTRLGAFWCAADDTVAIDLLAEHLSAHRRSGLAIVGAVSYRKDPQRSEGALATAVAQALGIRIDAEGKLGAAHTMSGLVPHLICGRWQHLVVLSANWCHWRAVAALTSACRAAGVTAWLVTTSELIDDEYTFYAQVGTRCDQADLAQTLKDLPTAEVALDQHDQWHDIVVPTSDFTTFLADVDEQLPAAQARVIEGELRAQHALALAWFAKHTSPQSDALAQQLRHQWNECGTVGQFLTRVRGWQVAAFSSNYLLKVDIDKLIGMATAAPPPGARTAAVWQLLNAWWEPGKAAGCALVAAGMGSEDASEVTVGQVTADGATATTGAEVFPVEEPARVHVIRARLARLLDGAHDDDRLLVTLQGRDADWRWVTAAVDEARRTYGIALNNGTGSRRALKPDRWANKHGLTLVDLA